MQKELHDCANKQGLEKLYGKTQYERLRDMRVAQARLKDQSNRKAKNDQHLMRVSQQSFMLTSTGFVP